MIKSKLNWD